MTAVSPETRTNTTSGTRTLTIAEAATRLGVKPWGVVRMIDAGQLRQVVLVDEASVTEMATKTAT